MISVIIPLFNNEKYISPCLDSLIDQTYIDWEAIIIDDGSTDNSYLIAKNFSKKDARIKLYHQENKRVGAARNNGIRHANGEYITFMDSDDILEPEAFETAMKVIGEKSADMVQWEAYFFKDNAENSYDYSKINKKNKEHCEIIANSDEAFLVLLDKKGRGSDPRYQMLKNSCRCVWTKLCKRNVFDGVWFPEGKEYEDDFIVHYLFLNSKRVVFINDELTNKRIHNSSVLHTMTLKGQFDHTECERERMIIAEKYKKAYGRYGQHYYYVSLLNLYLLCYNERNLDAKKSIETKFRLDYRTHGNYLSLFDKMIFRGFCISPNVIGQLYLLYRRIKKG